MRVSLVVPCYNEADGLPQLAAAIDDLRATLGAVHDLELVFVDDGSTDDTLDALRRHFDRTPGVQIFVHDRNRGLGAALRTGFAAATGDAIASVDSDCTYDPRELPAMLRLLAAGADVVVASPYHPHGGVKNVPPYRLFLSHNLSRLYDAVLGHHVYTYTSLFRLYRGEVLRSIAFESDGFLSMAEILVRALQRGARVVEYPTVLSLRTYGTSKAVVLRLIAQHARFLLGLVLARATSWRPARPPRPARPAPPPERLAAWNREPNREYGMAVLSEHPNPLIRWHERDRKRRVLRMVRPRPSDVVVEVGCERGDLSVHIVGAGRYLVCVDIDADVAAHVRTRLAGRRVGVVVADGQALPLRDGCADVSVSSHTVEHLPDPGAGLAELARITRAGGYLALNVPNDRWVLTLKRVVLRLMGQRFSRGLSAGLAPGHLWVFDASVLRRFCEGRFRLGRLSFNAPFFTNIFVIARPLSIMAGRPSPRGTR